MFPVPDELEVDLCLEASHVNLPLGGFLNLFRLLVPHLGIYSQVNIKLSSN